jgi:hypothetical protein
MECPFGLNRVVEGDPGKGDGRLETVLVVFPAVQHIALLYLGQNFLNVLK